MEMFDDTPPFSWENHWEGRIKTQSIIKMFPNLEEMCSTFLYLASEKDIKPFREEKAPLKMEKFAVWQNEKSGDVSVEFMSLIASGRFQKNARLQL